MSPQGRMDESKIVNGLSCCSLLPQQLPLCLLGEMFELEADAGRGNRRIFGPEIGRHLVDHAFVAARRELGVDDAFAVCLGGVAEEP